MNGASYTHLEIFFLSVELERLSFHVHFERERQTSLPVKKIFDKSYVLLAISRMTKKKKLYICSLIQLLDHQIVFVGPIKVIQAVQISSHI